MNIRQAVARAGALITAFVSLLGLWVAPASAYGGSGEYWEFRDEIFMLNVNSCGALHYKKSYWGAWTQLMPCGSAKSVAVSPGSQTVAVIRPDNTLVATQVAPNGSFGSWQQHANTGDSQAVALGPNGMIANVNACGALHIKTSYWGPWEQHMGCGSAKSVSIDPNGNAIVVVRPDNTLVAKQSFWGQWSQHVGVGDSRAAAAGINGTIANVNGAGTLYAKWSYWGQWEQLSGYGAAKMVSIVPPLNSQMIFTRTYTDSDGNTHYYPELRSSYIAGSTVAMVNSNNTVMAKRRDAAGNWSGWEQHVDNGDSKSVAIGIYRYGCAYSGGCQKLGW